MFARIVEFIPKLEKKEELVWLSASGFTRHTTSGVDTAPHHSPKVQSCAVGDAKTPKDLPKNCFAGNTSSFGHPVSRWLH